ncbi:MFS transporter [Enterococcus durans]|uniref:MFS transporter n=1 Tax=Enterococcus durans TaxID=53345 RepID=UPI0018831A26|nr:MFS transporter [Enterococcus durans]MBE9886740.1 MFS transporter [Enterococcus durans]
MTHTTNFLTLLKNRNFSTFVVIKTITITSSNILQFTLALYTLHLTKSSLIFSTVLSVMFFPRLFLTPIAGVLIDRISKKWILSISCIFFAVFLFLFSLIISDLQGIWYIYIIVIFMEVFEIFFSISSSTMVPSLFKGRDLGVANSFMSLLGDSVEIMVPFIAGVLFAILKMNQLLFLLSILFFSCSCFAVFIKIPATIDENDIPKKSTNLFSDFKDGISVVKQNSTLLTIILIAPLINFAISPLYDITLMYQLNMVYHLNSKNIGVILSVISFAGILTSLFLTKFFPSKNILKICQRIAAFLSFLFLLLVVFLFISKETTATIIVLIATFCIIISVVTILNIMTSTLLQNTTSSSFLARVISLLNFSATIAVPIGQLTYGFLLNQVSVEATFLTSSISFALIFFILNRRTYVTGGNVR